MLEIQKRIMKEKTGMKASDIALIEGSPIAKQKYLISQALEESMIRNYVAACPLGIGR